MKKTLLLIPIAVIACATILSVKSPLVITIHAQSLPVTKTLAWDAPSDAVSYIVTQDGVTSGSPTATTQPITITTVGSHTFTVTAVNLWGSSAPASLTVNVVLPGKPANVKVQ